MFSVCGCVLRVHGAIRADTIFCECIVPDWNLCEAVSVGGAFDFSAIIFICYRKKVSLIDMCQLFPYLPTLSSKKACSLEFRCYVAETRLSGTLHSNQFYSAGPKS